MFIGLGLVVATFAIARAPYEVPSPPGTPVNLGTTSSSCTVGYTAPYFDGGSRIIDYKIEYSGNWNPFWNVAGTTSSYIYTVHNLKESNEYEFRVRARNNAGESKPSGISEFITIQKSVNGD